VAQHKYKPSLFPLPKQSTRKITKKRKKPETNQLPPGLEAEAETEAALIITHNNCEVSLRHLLPAITQD